MKQSKEVAWSTYFERFHNKTIKSNVWYFGNQLTCDLSFPKLTSW